MCWGNSIKSESVEGWYFEGDNDLGSGGSLYICPRRLREKSKARLQKNEQKQVITNIGEILASFLGFIRLYT